MMLKNAVEIIEQMEIDYPMLWKYFKPEIRKIQDIALRERKLFGVKPKEPKYNTKEHKPRCVKEQKAEVP
jgi:hypothetical protein